MQVCAEARDSVSALMAVELDAPGPIPLAIALHDALMLSVQSVSRKGRSGASLADIANDVGFADQAHMCRVVRQLTGMTPQRFVRSQGTPMTSAFRIALAAARSTFDARCGLTTGSPTNAGLLPCAWTARCSCCTASTVHVRRPSRVAWSRRAFCWLCRQAYSRRQL